VILGRVVDRRLELDPVAAPDKAHDARQRHVDRLRAGSEVGVESGRTLAAVGHLELPAQRPVGQDPRRRVGAAPDARSLDGAEVVEVSHVGLVLDRVQPIEAPVVRLLVDRERPVAGELHREAVALDAIPLRRMRRVGRRELDRRRLEAAERDRRGAGAVDPQQKRPGERQRVDDTDIAHARCARSLGVRQLHKRVLGQELERPIERGVADEHVAVDLVARAAADRVVRVALEQLLPGERNVLEREPSARAQRTQGRERLDAQQPLLGVRVGLLEV
jgi:hypothetical protein